MTEHIFRSVASEGKRIPTWDIESILTRAVYRALNDGNNQLVNVDYPKFPSNVDKSRMTTDAQLQLRLVAERLCTRVERRYEKRLLQQREKDRLDTDRKLADIRAEYSEQVEMRLRELEREKKRLEERFAEKDRILRHKIELQLSEKENALEITRKSLETRLAELTMNKEHLDQAKAEFQAKFASDIELLNQEWAKISAKKEELRSLFRQEFEVEQQRVKRKSEELEEENAALKKKLSENNVDIYQMRSQLTKMTSLEEDLKITNEKLRTEVEEKHRLSRCSYEVELLRDENAQLKEEVKQLKVTYRELRVDNSLKTTLKTTEQAYVMKINELKNIIRTMSDKLTSLTSERDYLRQILRDCRKEISSDAIIKRREPLTTNFMKELKLRHHLQDADSSEDTSSSSNSVASSDLRNIKKRFTTLGDLAKTLDTTIDCVAAARSANDPLSSSPDLLVSENYDDFCRSLKQGVNRYSSPKKTAEKETKKPSHEDKQLAGPITSSANVEPLSELKRTIACSPTAATLSSQKMENDVTAEGVVHDASSDPTISFAERIRERNEMKRSLRSVMKEDSKKEEVLKSNAHTDNVMEKYLTLLSVKHQKAEELQISSAVDDADLESKLLHVEEVVLDKDPNSGDEIEW